MGGSRDSHVQVTGGSPARRTEEAEAEAEAAEAAESAEATTILADPAPKQHAQEKIRRSGTPRSDDAATAKRR